MASATSYVALLRAVNLGARAKVSMADLRSLCESLGYDDVRTYILSGNVLFRSTASAATIVRDLERRLDGDLGVKTTVILRTASDLAKATKANPFVGRRPAIDPKKLHVAFLTAKPTAAKAKTLAPPEGDRTECAVVGREVFLHYPDGVSGSKLGNAAIEKALGVGATTRSWGTVLKLAELSAAA